MNETLTLRQLAQAVGNMREAYKDITAVTMQVFLVVAANPGISSRDAATRSKVSQSAVSRHMAVLGETNWRGGAGLDLVEAVEDPEDRRTKLWFLTPKGQQMAMTMLATMDPQGPSPDLSAIPTAAEFFRPPRRGGAR